MRSLDSPAKWKCRAYLDLFDPIPHIWIFFQKLKRFSKKGGKSNKLFSRKRQKFRNHLNLPFFRFGNSILILIIKSFEINIIESLE